MISQCDHFQCRFLPIKSSLNIFNSCAEHKLLLFQFEMLLGRMESDGSRRPGCVDKFGIDTSDIISEIAKDTEKQGCLEDAVHLYDLAKVQMLLLYCINDILLASLES